VAVGGEGSVGDKLTSINEPSQSRTSSQNDRENHDIYSPTEEMRDVWTVAVRGEEGTEPLDWRKRRNSILSCLTLPPSHTFFYHFIRFFCALISSKSLFQQRLRFLIPLPTKAPRPFRISLYICVTIQIQFTHFCVRKRCHLQNCTLVIGAIHVQT
jgi:hypothetical protein